MDAVELQMHMEDFTDKRGFSQLITLISQMCGEKAEHLREVWNDDEAARDWDKQSEILEQMELFV